MTRHTDEVRADGRLAYPELAARDTVTDGHRILELQPLVHPSGMPAAATPVWISEEIPGVVVRLIRLAAGAERYKGSCYFAELGQGGSQINTYTLDLPTALGRLSGYLHEQLGTPITVTIPDPELELLDPWFPRDSCHYCGNVRDIRSDPELGVHCRDIEACRQRRSVLAGVPYKLYDRNDPVVGPRQHPHGAFTGHLETNRGKPIHPGPPIPRTFADVLKSIGRRLIGGDYHGPDADISDTDYVVFPNAGINLDTLFPDPAPPERPDLTGQADVAAELDHAMSTGPELIDMLQDPTIPYAERRAALKAHTDRTVAPFVYADPDGGTTRIGAAARALWADNPPLTGIAAGLGIAGIAGIAGNPGPEWTPVGLRDVPLTLSEYMADPPTRDTRTHFTGTYVTPPPPELNPEELMSELGAIMDLMSPVRLLRDLCSGEDEHRRDVFDRFLRDLATRVAEIAAALQDGVG